MGVQFPLPEIGHFPQRLAAPVKDPPAMPDVVDAGGSGEKRQFPGCDRPHVDAAREYGFREKAFACGPQFVLHGERAEKGLSRIDYDEKIDVRKKCRFPALEINGSFAEGETSSEDDGPDVAPADSVGNELRAAEGERVEVFEIPFESGDA